MDAPPEPIDDREASLDAPGLVGGVWGLLRRVGQSIENTLLPPVCGGCRRRGAWLCPACLASLRPVSRPVCHCGRPVRAGHRRCWVCAAWPPPLGPIRAAFVFEGALRTSIHRFKYHGEHARGVFLGALLAEHAGGLVEGRVEPPDVLLPVPLHPRRQRERGFNQAAILAQEIGSRWGIPVGDDLVRIVDTRAQVGLNASSRRANVRDAFRCDPTAVQGASVVLIDDVVTTGATMEMAARATLAAGARRVRGLALARELR